LFFKSRLQRENAVASDEAGSIPVFVERRKSKKTCIAILALKKVYKITLKTAESVSQNEENTYILETNKLILDR
jgi:hypothetical protein